MEEYTLVEHLTELRKRLMVTLAVFVITLGIGFYFSPQILNELKSHEVASGVSWNLFNYTDGIIIYLQCALIVGIGLTLPVAMYEAWQFMKPGLNHKERKGTFIFIPTAFLLFVFGITFAYTIIFPLMMSFMQNINDSIGATETYGMKQYFSFLFGILIPVALIFEMPVLIGFLTKIGLLNSMLLKKSRKIAYIALVIIGVSITPPDFLSDFLIIVPMLLLFEVSIAVAAYIERKERKKNLTFSNEG